LVENDLVKKMILILVQNSIFWCKIKYFGAILLTLIFIFGQKWKT